MIIAAVMIRRCCRRSVFFATQREPTNRAAARSWHASAPPTSVFAAEVARDQNIRENPIRHKQSARMSWIFERARGNITLVPSSNYAFVRSGKKQKVLIACSLFRLFLLPFSGFLPLLSLPTFPMEVICIRYGSSSAGSQSFHLAVITGLHSDFNSELQMGGLWHKLSKSTVALFRATFSH